MIKIYHNPRCSKSRQGLAIVEASGKPFTTVLYLKDLLTEKELRTIIEYLKCKPLDLVRKNESIWKEQFKGKTLSDDEIVSALAKFPKLIERPIVVVGEKAVIGRPPEEISTII